LPPAQATVPTTTTPTTPAPTTPITTNTGSGGTSGLTGTDAVLIAIGAIIVLGGISYFIWWDARKRAPVRAAAATAGAAGRRTGSKGRAKPRRLSPAERRRRKRGRAR
jgi:hypothetical protein